LNTNDLEGIIITKIVLMPALSCKIRFFAVQVEELSMHMDYYDFIINVYSALGLGLLIGLEREFRQHPAGLRTNALVCVGSALFMSLTFLLQKEGFETVVADTGPKAIAEFEKGGADLILLDLMLPGLSGTEVCRQIRTRSQVPIIMLTAKDTEVDKVVGLELGADDYVTKPYSSRELIARVRAVLRRQEEPDEVSGVLVGGNVRMDIERHIVSVDNVTISLPLKEFELLEFLMRNSGRVLTRIQLIDRVWGSDYVGDTKTLDVHVKRLRAKIEKDPANPEMIETVRGLGYKFLG
jgi:two-component system response regulator RegX3